MVGLHVQLDVEYASDDKLIEAGPMAELLYVRGLCFAKRTLTDGRITHGQLSAVAIGIPSPVKHARRLVEVGAWRATTTGYQIVSWLKRNKSAATVRAEADRKTKDSIAKNHKRWHVDEAKTSPTCPLCYPERDPAVDPVVDTPSDSSEVKAEAEVQPEVEVETKESSSSRSGTQVGDNPTPDDDEKFLHDVIKRIATMRAERGATTSVVGYRNTTLANLESERPTVAEMLADLPHLRESVNLAADWYEQSTWKLRGAS
jgi:hypothetical protein